MKISALSLAFLLAFDSPVEIVGQGRKDGGVGQGRKDGGGGGANRNFGNGANRDNRKSDVRKRGDRLPNLARLEEAVAEGGVLDQIQVKFRPTMSDDKITKALARTAKKTGCHSPKRIFPDAGAHEDSHRAAGLHLHYELECGTSKENAKTKKGGRLLASSSINGNGNNGQRGRSGQRGRRVADAIKNLSTESEADLDDDDKFGISSVDPSYEIALVGDSPAVRGSNKNKQHEEDREQEHRGLAVDMTGSNDPLLPEQSHYSTIKLAEAWGLLTDKSVWPRMREVVVQVVDSGKNPYHEDLMRNVWKNPGEICGNGLDDDGNGKIDDCYGYNHGDDNGFDLMGNGPHGTHCTGTIAADSDNGIGIAGVAGGMGGLPGVSIMTNVGFGKTGTGGFAEALTYGADMGAHISSNSWGYSSPGAYPSSIEAAVKYATDKGVLVVNAAGNDGTDERFYPGADPNVIAVASTDANKKASYFTCYGDWINITAPGSDVLSTVGTGPDDTAAYQRYSGTSMACPHVAGILALGKTLAPTATRTEALDCLYNTAGNIDSLNTAVSITHYNTGPAIKNLTGDFGAGMADTKAFLDCMMTYYTALAPTPSPAPTVSHRPSPAPTPCNGKTFRLEVTPDGYPQETSWEIRIADGKRIWFGNPSTGEVETTVCSPGTYTFAMIDSYGDGMCCGYGEGSYKIFVDGTLLHASDGQFGSRDETSFTLDLDGLVTTTTTTTTATTTTTTTTTEEPSTTTTTTTSASPTGEPTSSPLASPTETPVTDAPTGSPVASPSNVPSTVAPTVLPSASPTEDPTDSPSASPTKDPTDSPSASPTEAPTKSPSDAPTGSPLVSTTTTTVQATTTTTTTTTDATTGSPTASPSKPPATEAPATNAPTGSPSASPTCAGSFSLVLTTDNYPGETTWDLKNADTGAMILSGDGNGNSAATTITHEAEMCAPATYEFTIRDEYGDGICCGTYGDGNYKIYVDNVEVSTEATGGAEFGSKATTTFDVGVKVEGCGNGVCETDEESCGLCPSDCGACLPTNLALNKVATQSSTGYNGAASRAVDGNTDGDWAAGSISHTNTAGACNWWMVDLGADDVDVGLVKVYNRRDCCTDRLNDFTVEVLDSNEDVKSSVFHAGAAAVVTGAGFPIGTVGRYVKIENGCGDFLQLAEVEVFANSVGTPPPPADVQVSNGQVSDEQVSGGATSKIPPKEPKIVITATKDATKNTTILEPKSVALKPKNAYCDHSSECLSGNCHGNNKCK